MVACFHSAAGKNIFCGGTFVYRGPKKKNLSVWTCRSMTSFIVNISFYGFWLFKLRKGDKNTVCSQQTRYSYCKKGHLVSRLSLRWSCFSFYNLVVGIWSNQMSCKHFEFYVCDVMRFNWFSHHIPLVFGAKSCILPLKLNEKWSLGQQQRVALLQFLLSPTFM